MNILITGGSGMIGREVSRQLKASGHEVHWLSRNPGGNDLEIPEYAWDPSRGIMDETALARAEAIVNLAGANLNKRWTPHYKSEILRSRVDGTRLIFNKLQEIDHRPEMLFSASAAGYYPHSYDRLFNEDDPPGGDFLATVCQKWEAEAQNFESLGIRTVRGRIGVVLSHRGGAYPAIAAPVRWGLGAALGNGRQWMAWIHLTDVAAMIVKSVLDPGMSGVYNLGGPENVTNRQLTRAMARSLNRPCFLPPVPAVALKLVLGEMANVVLKSNKLSSERIVKAGFHYTYPNLDDALEEIRNGD